MGAAGLVPGPAVGYEDSPGRLKESRLRHAVGRTRGSLGRPAPQPGPVMVPAWRRRSAVCFRRFDADTRLVDASLRHILDEAHDFASAPCVLPRSPADG